jgi:hypothetical protein
MPSHLIKQDRQRNDQQLLLTIKLGTASIRVDRKRQISAQTPVERERGFGGSNMTAWHQLNYHGTHNVDDSARILRFVTSRSRSFI